MMFEKIKRNLFKFFKSSWYGERKNKAETVVEPIAENEEMFFVKQKVIDPREKTRRKLQMIARRAKSWRIRKKNIKRLVNYYE